MLPLLLVLIFIVVPIAELALIIAVGKEIGVGPTVLLLLADAILGSLLARSQGRTLWLNGAQPNVRTLIETVGLHRMPAVRLDGPLAAYSS